jgi:hypothetical protein
MVFISPDSGYIVTEEGSIFFSSDQGQIWNLEFVSDSGIYNITNDHNQLWACGDSGLALKKDFYNSLSELNTNKSCEIWPNPFQNFINIKLSTHIETKVEIYSVDNKLMRTYKINNSCSLNLNLSPGVYLLKTENSSGVTISKVIQE